MDNVIFYDNTRIQDFRVCERKFYYRHVRHWVPETPSIPLLFGGAWHKAMDVVWPMISNDHNAPTRDVAVVAMTAFESYWHGKYGLPSMADWVNLDPLDQETFRQRNPVTAFDMIIEYIEERRLDIASCELLSVEQPFAVLLSPDGHIGGVPTLYAGKIDKVVRREDGKIYGIEHKTTAEYRKEGPFKADFMDSFSPNTQIDGYLHALHMLYGKDVKGILVDAALVHKTERGFRYIPVDRQFSQLDAWLWNTHYRIQSIAENNKMLHKVQLEEVEIEPASLPYLPAFPQKTEACQIYHSNCPYIDLCKMWANPEAHELPAGFKEDAWDPIEDLDKNRLFEMVAKLQVK